MNQLSRFLILESLVERAIQNYPAAALVSLDGDVLVLRYQALADIGTLPVAALTCHQYFQVKPDDVIIINDPYSGGSLLSSINLVTGVQFDSSSSRANSSDALLVVRIPFKPRVSLASSVEAEGVRIPPTPLVHNGQMNQEVLEAICSHPLAPVELRQGIAKGIEQIRESQSQLQRVKAFTGLQLTKKAIKEWLQVAQDRFQDQVGHLAEGRSKFEIAISPKSKVALEIEIKNHRVAFNFTGSGAPERYALSDSATLGACVGALLAAMNVDVPINSGVYRALEVIAPLGSIVHARYPAPVFLGFTDGTALIAGMVLKILGQIDKKLQMGQAGLSICALELAFEDGRYFFDDMEPGGPATRERRGSDALDLWRRTHLQRSIESIERLYPIRVRSVAIRSESGGSGMMGGGDGQTKVLEVLKSAQLRWAVTRGVLKPEGAAGGKSAIGPEILVRRQGGEPEILSDFGSLDLIAGDQVILQSAGGGGYGEA